MSRSGAVLRCLIAFLVVIVFSGPLRGQEPWTERVIDQDIDVPIPVDSCMVPGRAIQLARIVNQPAGAEFLPEACEPSKQFTDRISLRGLTAREALDRLVGLDRRYTWAESEGVLVVRPLAAWTERDHFLHRTVSSFSVSDHHIGGALDAIKGALGPFRSTIGDQYAPTTPQAGQRFSVELSATSILEALNAIVRAHGTMFWSITYCQPMARYENATVRLTTFDGAGLGSGAVLTDANGKRYSPCQGKGFR